jgi:WD40 repeat protein/transcriptional regulator with XRE-family HTH domain
MVTEQPALSFAGLLRQLRTEARLTQEELAAAAGVSVRSVSNLERSINRTAHKDTAVLLAGALGLTGPTADLFVAAARGTVPAAQALAAVESAGQQTVTGSPYRGLAVFGEQDAGWFFGREAATAEMLDRMSRLLAGAGLLVVSGASGAGKSSLLRAGVLPRIRAGGLVAAPGAASWPCVLFTPTRAPLDELALRVAPLAGADAAAVRRGLAADPDGFALTARQAALARPHGQPGTNSSAAEQDQPSRPRRLLLVVDQFEELFTQCAEEGQRRAFIAALYAAATAGFGPDQAPAALVVLGVRADFEARCADYPLLAGPVQDRYLVTAMTGRQLRMAITDPAKKAGSKVDDDLVDALLAEVRNGQPGTFGAGVLPLLSHALDQAWRNRAGETLTLADYERTGGIEGAVAASAQRVYDGLTPARQATARQVFLRLAATSSDGVDSADRATRAELTDGKSTAEIQDVEAVLEAFAAERLLTLAADTVELSHEALLTAWPLLRDSWLADTHADRIVRSRLRATAAEWARQSRDPSYLYAGSLLQAATDTATRTGADPARHPPLSQTERDFLHASSQAHRRTIRLRRAVIAGLLALTVTALTTAGIAVRNAATAGHQHVIALSRQLAAESLNIDGTEPVIARRLAVAAWAVSPTGQAASAITTLLAEQQQQGMLPVGAPLQTAAGPNGGVYGVAFSPDGKLLASADGDGTVRRWDPATGCPVGAPLHASARNGVRAVAFSPDGKRLASADGDGTVRRWDPATGRSVGGPLQTGSGPSGGVYGVAFSPDGKRLASAGGDGTVRLWDPATGRRVGGPLQTGSGPSGGVYGAAFSPDGKLLASADGDGTVRLWDPATGRRVGGPLQTGSGPSGGVLAVAFSPSDKLLVSASGDGTVRRWDPATGRPVGGPLQTGSGPLGVFGVAFSPDGKRLVSAGGDGTVRRWDPVTGRPVGAPLQATSTLNGVSGVAFSPDGRLLASADGDGTVRLWDPAIGQPAGAFLHASALNGVSGVAFSPDDKLLASAGGDGTVRLWDPATRRPVGAAIRTGSGPDTGGVSAVAFSPDGKLLAGAGGDGTVRRWDPATRHPVGAAIRTGSGPDTGGVSAVAFSPDGKLLASAGGDGTVRRWDPATRRPVGAPLYATSARYGVHGVAFSPDGKLLASGDGDGTVRLWNPATGRPVGAPLQTGSGPAGGVLGVAFSPDGTLLAEGDGDGTVRLWNPATRQPVGLPLHATSSARYGVSSVAFSPDGKLLASGDGDGAVRLWNPATGQPVGAPIQAGAQTAVIAVAFSPDGKLLASAGGDGTVRLWQASLFAHPYAALCAYVGSPTPHEWNQHASGEPQPKVCG